MPESVPVRKSYVIQRQEEDDHREIGVDWMQGSEYGPEVGYRPRVVFCRCF